MGLSTTGMRRLNIMMDFYSKNISNANQFKSTIYEQLKIQSPNATSETLGNVEIELNSYIKSNY